MSDRLSRLTELIQNLALASLSILLTAGALELIFRLTHPPHPELRQPQVRYVRVDADPARGRSSGYAYLVPNQQAFHLEAPVSSNSLGLRGPEIQQPKPAGRYRILAVGDSHTFGFGVAESDTWPSILERRLRRADGWRDLDLEVVNGGIEALSLDQEVQLFKDRLLELEPDLVLWAYYWNDMPMSGDPSETPPAAAAIESDDGASSPRPANRPAAGGLARIQGFLKKSYVLYFVVQRVPALQMAFFPTDVTRWKRATLEGRGSARIDAAWAHVARRMAELVSLAEEIGFELIVIPLPLFEQMTSSIYSRSLYQDRLETICGELGITFLDPLSEIRAIEPSYPRDFIPFDGHPRRRVYEALAGAAAAVLTARPPQSGAAAGS